MASNPIYYARNRDDNFFRKRYITTMAFGLGLLLFFLPFAELKCGPITMLKNTGVGLATGSKWEVGMNGNELIGKYYPHLQDNGTTRTQEVLESGMNIYLLVAIAAAIFGMFVVLSHQKWKNIAAMCAGILACIMLIALMIQLRMLLRSALGEPALSPQEPADPEELEESMGELLKMNFTIWYYFSLVSFGCAAFFSYKKYKLEMNDEMKGFVEFDFQKEKQSSTASPGQ